jgi:hypothetical protein
MSFQIQICNEFSDNSVYVLECDSVYQARYLALEKLKQDTVDHVKIIVHGTISEKLTSTGRTGSSSKAN